MVLRNDIHKRGDCYFKFSSSLSRFSSSMDESVSLGRDSIAVSGLTFHLLFGQVCVLPVIYISWY